MKTKFTKQQSSKKSSHLKVSLKLTKKSGSILFYHTGKVKRIYSIVRQGNFSNSYLKVSYGKHKDVFGKLVEFYNDGHYSNRDDLVFAFKAFTEKQLVEELQDG